MYKKTVALKIYKILSQDSETSGIMGHDIFSFSLQGNVMIAVEEAFDFIPNTL